MGTGIYKKHLLHIYINILILVLCERKKSWSFLSGTF